MLMEMLTNPIGLIIYIGTVVSWFYEKKTNPIDEPSGDV